MALKTRDPASPQTILPDMATRPTPIRLPVSLIEALDVFVENMNRETPGLNVNRADAVRLLLLWALEEYPRRRQPKPS